MFVDGLMLRGSGTSLTQPPGIADASFFFAGEASPIAEDAPPSSAAEQAKKEAEKAADSNDPDLFVDCMCIEGLCLRGSIRAPGMHRVSFFDHSPPVPVFGLPHQTMRITFRRV